MLDKRLLYAKSVNGDYVFDFLNDKITSELNEGDAISPASEAVCSKVFIGLFIL